MPSRGIPRPVIALAVLAAALSGAPLATAAGAVLESSEPAVGGSLSDPTHVDLRFTGPVELPSDGIRLLGPDGAPLPIGPPEALADGTVRVPIAGTGTGLRALSWSGTSGGDPVSGSIAFDVGPAATGSLPIGRLAAASTGGALATALVGVGLAVAALVALLIARGARIRSDAHRVPLPAVLIGAAAVALIGALGGLWMVQRSRSAIGAGDADTTQLWIAFAAAAIIAFAAAVLARAAGRRWPIGAAIAVLAALGAVASLLAPPLPEAAAAVDSRLLLDGGAAVDVGVEPGAVGRNRVLVSVQGVEAAATDTVPVLVLRPLDGSLGPMRVPLVVGPDGTAATDALLLVLPGRWRGQVEGLPGIAADEPVLFDFSVQPNPGVAGG